MATHFGLRSLSMTCGANALDEIVENSGLRRTSGTPATRTSSSASSRPARCTASNVTARAVGDRVATSSGRVVRSRGLVGFQRGDDLGDGASAVTLIRSTVRR
jgi:hypothetical protein